MKKILIFVSAVCLTAGLYAQTDVEQGTSHNYSVSVNNGVTVAATGYTWSADPGLSAIITNGTTATSTVVFNGVVGTLGNLSVSATSQTGSCPSTAQTKQFHIVAPASITLYANIPAIADICPYDATNNPSGGDILLLTIAFTAPVTGYNYAIDGIAQTPVTGLAPASNQILNTSSHLTSGGAHTITLTSITPAAGNTVSYPTALGTPNQSFNVLVAPILNGIQ